MTTPKTPYLMSAEDYVRLHNTMKESVPEEELTTMDKDTNYWFFIAKDSAILKIELTFQATPHFAKTIHATYNGHPVSAYILYGGFTDRREMVEFVIDSTVTPEETIRNLAFLASADSVAF